MRFNWPWPYYCVELVNVFMNGEGSNITAPYIIKVMCPAGDVVGIITVLVSRSYVYFCYNLLLHTNVLKLFCLSIGPCLLHQVLFFLHYMESGGFGRQTCEWHGYRLWCSDIERKVACLRWPMQVYNPARLWQGTQGRGQFYFCTILFYKYPLQILFCYHGIIVLLIIYYSFQLHL